MPKKDKSKSVLSPVKIAEDTLRLLACKTYTAKNGVVVPLQALVTKSVDETILYTPQDCAQLKEAFNAKRAFETEICVEHCTTLDACEKLVAESESVLALNFASALHPGGGFKTGAKAQEESLARSSGLYLCLTRQAKFYAANRRADRCLYTDNIIYSPKVPFFRKHTGEMLENGPYCIGVISAPAVNFNHANKKMKDSSLLIDTMQQRAEYILTIASQHQHEVLVLGAWGCGAFRFPVHLCATVFRDLLVGETARFAGVFKKVVFAIYKENMVLEFEDIFASGGESDEQEEGVVM